MSKHYGDTGRHQPKAEEDRYAGLYVPAFTIRERPVICKRNFLLCILWIIDQPPQLLNVHFIGSVFHDEVWFDSFRKLMVSYEGAILTHAFMDDCSTLTFHPVLVVHIPPV